MLRGQMCQCLATEVGEFLHRRIDLFQKIFEFVFVFNRAICAVFGSRVSPLFSSGRVDEPSVGSVAGG